VPYEPINAEERYPINVSKNKVSMEVPVHRRMSRLPGDVRMDVEKFLSQYRSSGNGRLAVVRPKRSRHRTAMATATAELQKLITAAGIDHRSVVYTSYASGSAGTTAPIMLSFQSYVAIGPECGDWSKNTAVTYDNLPHPNFGCAGQQNLAAMISNPRDLVTPRTMTPTHAGRRDIVMEQYRTGAGTEADTSASEEGGVSEVGQ
jgi:pilus assembly protein CpaD